MIEIKSISKRLFFLVLLSLVFLSKNTFSTTFTSTIITTGTWSSSNIWSTSRTGQITSATNSTTVNGTGTLFSSELSVGVVIRNSSHQIIGTVESITSDVLLTLTNTAQVNVTEASYNASIIPTSSDNIVVSDATTLFIDNNYTCNSVSFNSSVTASNAIYFSDTFKLTVNGAITLNDPSVNNLSSSLSIQNGKVECASLNLYGSTFLRKTEVLITSGTLDINGSLTCTNAFANSINISSSGKLKFGGSISTNLTLVLAGGNTSTIYFDAEGDQTLPQIIYYNIELSGSGTKTGFSYGIQNNFVLSGTANTTTSSVLNLAGNLTIGNGCTFNIASYNITVNGTTTINTGGWLSINSVSPTIIFNDLTINTNGTILNTLNHSYTVKGNFTNNSNFSSGTGTITFSGTSKSINGTVIASINNLAISGTYTLNSELIITNSLSGSGTLTMGATGKMQINCSNTPTITSLSANIPGNTITYGYEGAQTILNINYHNLSLSGSGLKNLQTGTTTINGNLSLSGSASTTLVRNLDINGNANLSGTGIFTSNSFTVNLSGDFTCINRDQLNFAGTLILDGINQTFTSTGGTTIPIANLTLIGGIKTFNSTVYVANTLNINSDSKYQFGEQVNLGIEIKNLSGTGVFAAKACEYYGNQIIISGTAANVNLYMDPVLYHIATVSNVKTSGNLNFMTAIAINYQFIMSGANNVYTVFYDELNLYGNNLTFSNLSNVLVAGGPNSSLKFGGCSTNGSLITLPNDFFNKDTIVLKNLTVDRTNGVKFSTQNIKVTGVVTLSSGNLNTNHKLILASTSSQTARVAPLGTTASITGSVTVERYIPGGSNKRKWRLLSSPINVSGSIMLSQFIDDILVTAPSSIDGGFDDSPSDAASIRTYNESVPGSSNLGWTDPTNISNMINTGYGIGVFVRGTRDLANPYLNWTIPNDVTLDYTGELNSGAIPVTLSFNPSNGDGTTADGFNLVGNPYASPINFDTTGWTKTRIENKFWCYNPNTANYGIYDADLHTGTNGITKYIASGQGFFVRANQLSPSLTFTENIKAVQSGNNYFRPSQSVFPMLRIKLKHESTDYDEALIIIDPINGSSSAYDKHDAGKLFNDALNIYTVTKDRVNLTINAINTPAENDTINLSVWSYDSSGISTKKHQLSFEEYESIDKSINIFLFDNFLNTITDIRTTNQYDFVITSDSKSYGNNRFKLLFNNTSSGINNTENASTVNLFPNPANDKLYVKYVSGNTNRIDYIIYDYMGKMLLQNNALLYNNTAEIAINTLQKGQYFLRINNGHTSITKRFIKN